MSEQWMRTVWDATVDDCLTGHDDCTYGGMTPQSGYWLAADGCTRLHDERCAWCLEAAETGFSDWAPDGFSIYRVPACMSCALQWTQIDPRWKRATV
jgi:hypothetical protein